MESKNAKPVDLLSKVEKDSFSMSVFMILDICLLALMIVMTQSKFVLAPGFSIDLNSALSLPKVSSASIEGVLAEDSITVLNIRGRGTIIFDGKIYTEDSFARIIKNYKPKGTTLLLKADAGVGAQTILQICTAAKAAGFDRVHLAAYSED